jgi:hypothetical protein
MPGRAANSFAEAVFKFIGCAALSLSGLLAEDCGSFACACVWGPVPVDLIKDRFAQLLKKKLRTSNTRVKGIDPGVEQRRGGGVITISKGCVRAIAESIVQRVGRAAPAECAAHCDRAFATNLRFRAPQKISRLSRESGKIKQKNLLAALAGSSCFIDASH